MHDAFIGAGHHVLTGLSHRYLVENRRTSFFTSFSLFNREARLAEAGFLVFRDFSSASVRDDAYFTVNAFFASDAW